MRRSCVLFVFVILFAGLGLAQTSEPSFCCERTNDGAWCMNDVENECDSSYNAAPTSCDTTSYCRTGTCYDSEEGICMGNTPQRVCIDNGGTWDAREPSEVPQCQLGCCVIADQAAFVSLVRCKKLSSFFGVENDYRSDVGSEVECIAEAQSQDIGACVYEKEFERVCEFTTRGECGAGEEVETLDQVNLSISSEKTFYEGYLCSAEELGTSCAKQSDTTCYQGDVYWVDSCGNRENVYSANKDKSWNNGRVAEPVEVCAAHGGTNRDCGNCDYLLGSRCSAGTGFDSEHYCQKTECVDRNGQERKNGESWCVKDASSGDGLDRVGSRYYREICVDGEVKVEACADYRNEICLEGFIETSEGEFGTAACRVNRWQDCVLQSEEDDCLNIDRRDCAWLPSVTGMVLGSGSEESGTSYSNPVGSESSSSGDMFNNPTASPITGNAIFDGDDEEKEGTSTNRPDGVCVPNFPPGLEFWEENSAQQICGQANARCVVVYEKGLTDSSWKIKEGEECLEEAWAMSANRVCVGLGDCGGYVNYEGEYSSDGYSWVEDGEEREFSPNGLNIVRGGFTGMVVGIVERLFD